MYSTWSIFKVGIANVGWRGDREPDGEGEGSTIERGGDAEEDGKANGEAGREEDGRWRGEER